MRASHCCISVFCILFIVSRSPCAHFGKLGKYLFSALAGVVVEQEGARSKEVTDDAAEGEHYVKSLEGAFGLYRFHGLSRNLIKGVRLVADLGE